MKKTPIPNGSIVIVNQSGLYLVDGDWLIALFARRVGAEYRYWRYQRRKDQRLEVVGAAMLPIGRYEPTQWPQYTEFVAGTWIKYDFKLQNGD